MNVLVKLSILFLASVVANAAPVRNDLVTAAVDDIDEVYDRQRRSPDATAIPWHLDRIDQRQPQLDGKYNVTANGKIRIAICNIQSIIEFICLVPVTVGLGDSSRHVVRQEVALADDRCARKCA